MTTFFHSGMFAALALFSGFDLTTAHAQTPSQTLKTLKGYEPTVIASEAEALKLYQSMPTDLFKAKSQCHQRAHNWAYNFYNQHQIKSMKVYLFFTARYQREFAYDWAYHVAPLIPVRLADGTIEDQVFDPTFTAMPAWADESDAAKYDNKPIPVSEWTKYFIFPDAECPVVDNYNDFINFQDRYYCYIMKAPMYHYIPDNFKYEQQVRTDWRPGDLLEMRNGLSH